MAQDSITLKRIQTLHPDLRDEALEIYEKICEVLTGRAVCRFAYTLRSFPEQAALYAQGRTVFFDKNGKKLGKVTNAKPGQSMHNYGLAIDIVLLKDVNGDGIFESASWESSVDFDKDGKADWKEIVEIFKSYGWSWGGDWKSFKDLPHFEKTFGNTTKQLIAKYNAKKFIPGTEYIKF